MRNTEHDPNQKLELYLSREAYKTLVTIQTLTEQSSVSGALRSAIELYREHHDAKEREARKQ